MIFNWKQLTPSVWHVTTIQCSILKLCILYDLVFLCIVMLLNKVTYGGADDQFIKWHSLE